MISSRSSGADTIESRPSEDQLIALGAQRLAKFLSEETRSNSELRRRVQRAMAKAAESQPDKTGVELAGAGAATEPHMVGNSPPMAEVFLAVRKMAITDAPVLITGDSGTGKELAALAIHERSAFCKGPFVAVNCAGIPATLIASELFGHEKGAFTGAHQRQIGRVESAQGGTLFLDEIGDLPPDLQVHLLRFLQQKTIERVGGVRSIKIDTRIIAATHQNVEALIAQGRFREDLYYRLNVLRLRMPPLRERGTDLDLLSTYFLRIFAREMNRPLAGFKPCALEAIRRHSWPGNVRELISSIRRAVVMAEDEQIGASDLGIETSDAMPSTATLSEANSGNAGDKSNPMAHIGERGITLEKAKSQVEKEMLRSAMERKHRNMTDLAQELGISRVTLYRLIAKHDLHSQTTSGIA